MSGRLALLLLECQRVRDFMRLDRVCLGSRPSRPTWLRSHGWLRPDHSEQHSFGLHLSASERRPGLFDLRVVERLLVAAMLHLEDQFIVKFGSRGLGTSSRKTSDGPAGRVATRHFLLRIALCLEYDGRAFCGFQSQADGCGVQDALEHALRRDRGRAGRRRRGRAHRCRRARHRAGRAFRHRRRAPATRAWVRGVNAHLPRHSRRALGAAGRPTSSTRASPRTRATTPTCCSTAPQRPACSAGRVGWYHRPLDVDAMRDGGAALVGTHDFSAFRAAECQAKTPVQDAARARRRARRRRSCASTCRQRVPASHGAQHRRRAGLRRRRPAAGRWIGELLAARDRTRARADVRAGRALLRRRRLRRGASDLPRDAPRQRRCLRGD